MTCYWIVSINWWNFCNSSKMTVYVGSLCFGSYHLCPWSWTAHVRLQLLLSFKSYFFFKWRQKICLYPLIKRELTENVKGETRKRLLSQNYTPSISECKVYSLLTRILKHGNFVHGGIILHGENKGRGVSKSHKLKTIRQISPWRDLIHLWSGKIV